MVIDENSTNGTRINGHKINQGQPTPLRGGDNLAFGGVEFRVIY